MPNIGPHFIGRGEEFALQAAESTRDNRELFTTTLKEHDLYPMNTHFELQPKCLVTYKELATEGGPPWDAVRYATLDYLLIPGRWKNCVAKVWSTPDTQIDTDHYLLRGTLKCKLAARKKRIAQQRETYSQPDAEQRKTYNEAISANKTKTAG